MAKRKEIKFRRVNGDLIGRQNGIKFFIYHHTDLQVAGEPAYTVGFRTGYGGSNSDCAPTYVSTAGYQQFTLEGAMEFCQRLRDGGLELAIATNGLPAAQWGRYRGTGLDRVVPHLLVSVELGAAKPDPAFFDRALDKLGITDRSAVVMVGDGLETDILGANRAGIDTVWYDPERKPLSGPAVPTYTAASYDEIRALLLG